MAALEADFQGADIKGTANATNAATVFPFPAFTLTSTGSQKIDWLGTLRGRLGWLPVNQLLIYATGGLAYGHVETGVSFSGNIPITGFPISGSTALFQSNILVGWTVGGGLEWMFAPRWSVKAEYLYYDLGKVTLNQTLASVQSGVIGFFANANVQSIAHYNGNIARLGVNYKF